MRLALGLTLLLAGAAARASEDTVNPAVVTAIEQAVRARVGEGFQVHVEDLTVHLARAGVPFDAVPVPAARLSKPVRFALVTVPEPDAPRVRVRIGEATATVRVTGPVLRASRDLPRNHVITRNDFVVQDGDAGDALIASLPAPAEAEGAATHHDVRAGELLTHAVLRAMALVESGQVVTTVVVIGRIGVEGRAVASQRGTLGQIIRLVNTDSRRPIRGRVSGAGRVEVLHEP